MDMHGVVSGCFGVVEGGVYWSHPCGVRTDKRHVGWEVEFQDVKFIILGLNVVSKG